MPEVSICVATYLRPEGLKRLLRSLAGLAPGTPEFEVIVVDNDIRRSAEQIVKSAIDDGMRVRYLCEPVRSISRARNRGVSASSGDFVAFLDDDESAASDWLLNLHRGLTEAGADAAFGAVISRFGSVPPRWIDELGFFTDGTPATGTELAWHDTTTGNALVPQRALDSLVDLFDEELGMEGGEDVDLFARLAENGGRLIGVDNAIVFEDIPRSRLTRRWMVRRYLRNGGTLQRIVCRRQTRRQLFGFALSAAWKSCTSICRALAGTVTGRPAGIRELFRAIGHLGVVLGVFGIRVKEYGRDR